MDLRAVTCLCVALGLWVPSVQAANPKTSNGINQIEVVLTSPRHRFTTIFGETFKRHAEEKGMKSRDYDADDKMANQIAHVQKVAAENTAFVVRIVDDSKAGELIEAVKPTGAPIVFVNLPPKPIQQLNAYENAWYVGSVSEESGEMQAELVIEYLQDHPEYDLNGNGTLDILMFTGPENHPDAIFRTQKIEEALKKSGIKYRIIDKCKADWFFEPAFRYMKNIMEQGEYKNIEMIISNNDEMAMGAIYAIEESQDYANESIDIIPVFGVDGLPDAINAIRRGSMVGSVRQNYDMMARISLAIAMGNYDPQTFIDMGCRYKKDRVIIVPYNHITKADLKPRKVNK